MTISCGKTGPRVDGDEASRLAEHIAAMAEALVRMGPTATTISTDQRVSADLLTVIEDLLPTLAVRQGLRAQTEVEGDHLTVTFERA